MSKLYTHKLYQELNKLSNEQLLKLADNYDLYDERTMKKMAKSLEVQHPVYNNPRGKKVSVNNNSS